jgi:hypothetical protein
LPTSSCFLVSTLTTGCLTPCSQSQFGQDRYLGKQGSQQVEAVVVLSVAVRSGPLRTAVNGTFVARPARMTWHSARVGSALTIR